MMKAVTGPCPVCRKRIVFEFSIHDCKPLAEDEPQYEHHCKHCTFLGRYVMNLVEFDLYHCAPRSGALPTVLARYGNQNGDYYSGIEVAKILAQEAEHKNNPLVVALYRANARGLRIQTTRAKQKER